MSTHLSLCQDCGTPHYFSAEQIVIADEINQSGNALCPCGGDVCDCSICVGAVLNILEFPF